MINNYIYYTFISDGGLYCDNFKRKKLITTKSNTYECLGNKSLRFDLIKKHSMGISKRHYCSSS